MCVVMCAYYSTVPKVIYVDRKSFTETRYYIGIIPMYMYLHVLLSGSGIENILNTCNELMTELTEVSRTCLLESSVFERPVFLDLPSADDQLLQTFDMVDTPKSVLSLSSNDSLHQVPSDHVEMGKLELVLLC